MIFPVRKKGAGMPKSPRRGRETFSLSTKIKAVPFEDAIHRWVEENLHRLHVREIDRLQALFDSFDAHAVESEFAYFTSVSSAPKTSGR
jgi:hypothetical protein